ncbi:MAG TPA: inositol monophosphatase family protein [Actinomycetota bacterium]
MATPVRGGELALALGFALELADEADEIALRYFSRSPAVFTKQDGTLVTQADREIETVLRKRIEERFPGHVVLGEEQGLSGGGVAVGSRAPRWVVDPIDGTNNFAWGIPIFATLIALQVGGETEVGVVSAPALGERYDAAVGLGARMNGSPITVSDVGTLAESRVGFASWAGWVEAGLERQWGSILTRCRRSRGFGDFWGHMLVARGAAEAMAEPDLQPWDVAALSVIVSEAGGRLTDFSGAPFRGRGSCLTTNGLIHDEILAELGAE